MTTHVRLWALLSGVLVAGACKPESARKADKAAEEVTEAREQLRRAQEDLVEEREDINNAETPDKVVAEKADLVTESKDVVEEAGKLAKAEAEFRRRRELRIQVLRGEHEVVGTQPMLISSMATDFPLTDAGRADVNEKLTTFQNRLDEAANLIEGLENADADVWTTRDEEATEAMHRLEEARKSAWDALDDAPKADRNAT